MATNRQSAARPQPKHGSIVPSSVGSVGRGGCGNAAAGVVAHTPECNKALGRKRRERPPPPRHFLDARPKTCAKKQESTLLFHKKHKEIWPLTGC
jgi:hypothetical protein